MCGVSGWVDFTKDLRNEKDSIEKMTKTLAKRGNEPLGSDTCRIWS
jgi:asparagine synthase (glutamine-hydrolysing)